MCKTNCIYGFILNNTHLDNYELKTTVPNESKRFKRKQADSIKYLKKVLSFHKILLILYKYIKQGG